MATRLAYLINSAASGSSHGSLQIGGSAPATATTATEWIVNKNGSPNYALMVYNNNVATWTTTALPNAAPTTNDCFRTNTGGSANDGKLTGTFTSGNWTVSIPVIAVTSGGDQDGRIRVRIWRSSSATGSGATEMTNGATQLSIVTNLVVGTPQTSSGSVAVTQNLTLSGEYIFLQIAWEITGAGGANGRDVLIRVGSTSSVTTTEFKETFNTGADETAAVTESVAVETNYVRTLSDDTISVSDSVGISREFSIISSDSISVSDTVDVEKIVPGIIRTIDDTAIAVSDSVSLSYPWDLASWWRGYGGTVPWSGTSSYSAGVSGTNALSTVIPDPGKKSLLLWYRAPWDASSPWRHTGAVGQAVGGGGATAGSDLITSGALPTAGISVNGWAPLDFDGTTQALSNSSSAIDNYLPASGFIIGVLFRADTATTADALPYNNPSLFSNPESIAFTYASHSGVPSLSAAYYDGTWRTVSTVAAGTLTWHAAWLRYASGTLSIKLNGGNWTSVATGLSNRTVTANTWGWFVGKTAISTTKWFDGRMLEVITAASLTDTEIDEIHSYWNDRYTLTIPVGNNVPTAGVFEEPNKYGATMLVRAPCGTGGIRSEATKSVTWNKRGFKGTNNPTSGTAVNGFVPAVFNGTSTDIQDDPAVGSTGNYISSTAWYFRILCKTTSAPTNAGAFDADGSPLGESQGVLGIGIRNNSGTFQVRACHYDTAQRPTAFQNLTTGWQLIEAWFTGGTVYCSVDGATPVSAGAGAYGNVGSVVLTSGVLKMGKSWSSGNFWGGEVLEVTVKNAIPTDDEREMYRSRYLKDRYILTIGSQLPARYPVSGTTLHGYGTADFQGSDYIEGERLSEYWTATAGSGWALVNISSCSSNDDPTGIASGQSSNTNLELNPYIIMSTVSPGSNTCDWGVYVRNSSGTLFFGYRQWTTDGVTPKEYYVETSLSSGVGKWVLIQWRYGSSQLAIRLNNGSWSTASATTDLSVANTLNGKVYLGRNQAASLEYIDGRIAEAALATSRLNDDTFSDVYTYVQTRYFTYTTSADDTAAVTDSVTGEIVVPSGTTYTRTVDDTAAVTDSATIEVSRALSDTVTISDTTTTALTYERLSSDTAAFSDSATITVEKSLTETATATDNSTTALEYGRAASDTAVVSDSVSNTVERSPADSVSVSDQTNTSLSYLRTISDTSTVTDSATITVERSPAESVTVTDSSTTSIEYLRLLSDTAIVTESVGPEAHRSPSDSISVADSTTAVLLRELTGQANDSVSVTDAQVLETNYIRSAIDSAAVADSVAPQAERSPSDSVATTETLTASTFYDKSVSDSSVVSDYVSITTERSLSDAITVTEALTKEAYSNRIFSDTAVVSDAITFEHGRSPTDSVTATDALTLVTDYHRLVTDTPSVTDVTHITVERAVTESITISDSTSTSFEYLKTPSDTSTVSDSTSLTVEKSLFDSIVVAESLLTASSYVRFLTESLGVIDNVSVDVGAGLFVSQDDSVAITDQVTASTAYARSATDSSSVTDQGSWEAGKSVSDTATVADIATQTIFASRDITDSVFVAESITTTVEITRADSVSVLEALATTTDYVRNTNESVVVDDLFIIEFGAVLDRQASDSASVTDTVNTVTSYTRPIVDAPVTVDYVSIAIEKHLSDTISVIESVTAALEQFTSVQVSDSVSITDATSIEVSKTMGDALTVVDTRSIEASYTKTLTDTTVIADASSWELTKSANDIVSVTDFVEIDFKSFSEVAVSDFIAISDTIAVVVDLARMDVVSTQDIASTTITYARLLAETSVVQDQTSITTERSPSDSLTLSEVITLEKAFSRALSVDALSTVDTVIIEKAGDVRIELDTDDLVITDAAHLYADYLIRLATDSASTADSVEGAKSLHLDILINAGSELTAQAPALSQRPQPLPTPIPAALPIKYGYISVQPGSPVLPGQTFVSGLGKPYSTVETLLLYRSIKAEIVILATGYRVYRIQFQDLWRLDSDSEGPFIRHGPSTKYRVEMTDPTESIGKVGTWRPVY